MTNNINTVNANTVSSMNSIDSMSVQNLVNIFPLNQTEQFTFTKEMFRQLVDDVMDELDNRDYSDANRYAVERMIQEWYFVKEPLLRLLSKHPNWNPSKYMIQFDADYTREILKEGVNNFAWWTRDVLMEYYRNKAKQEKTEGKLAEEDITYGGLRRKDQDFVMALYCLIRHINTQFFTNNEWDDLADTLDAINAYNDRFSLRTNMKSSKAILKVFRTLGLDKEIEDFDKKFAAFSDCVNPIKVTRHTCISLNPIDFLLMSNGNSWRSCHFIGENPDDAGCYSSGTISYMLDDVSFIFYTVDGSFNGTDIELEKKMTRQVFGYKDEQFLQSRMYPQDMDHGAEEQYQNTREIVQKVLADCLNKPNFWMVSKTKVKEIVRHGFGATCYPDWRDGNPGSSHCSISTLKGRGDRISEIIMGARPICPCCGERHEHTENIRCEMCNGDAVCEGCGYSYDRDDLNWVEEEQGYYCNDCSFYCEQTGQYHLNRNAVTYYYLNRYDRICDEEVYDGWAENNATWVENRCEYWDPDDCVYIESNYGEYRIRTEEGDTFFECEGTNRYYDEDDIVTVVIDGEYHHYSKEYFDENKEDIEAEAKEEFKVMA